MINVVKPCDFSSSVKTKEAFFPSPGWVGFPSPSGNPIGTQGVAESQLGDLLGDWKMTGLNMG